MPPIVKENEISTARPEIAQRPASPAALPGDTAIKQQPVALEVPVSVNGARAMEGSDKREPFSESTKTVLIFGNGAVIRLSSSVAPGQLLFLTNEKTKKEVVCQVVKSKNYRNVSGYVELEFTENVVGFWGMRFPGDRIGSAPQSAAPASVASFSSSASGSPAIPRPVAPRPEPPLPQIPPMARPADLLAEKPVAPAAPLSSKLATSFDPEAPLNLPSVAPVKVVPVVPVAPVQEVSANTSPEKAVTPEPAFLDSPRASEAQASFLEPAKSTAVPSTQSLPNLLALFEPKQAAPAVVPPPAPPSTDPETDALKQHTARLQEQLSSLHFSGEAAAPSTVSVQIPHEAPVEIEKELAENAARVLQMSQIYNPEPESVTPAEPAKLATPPAKSALEAEELKIPAWLEPLARNAAAPSSTQDLIEREKAKRLAEQPKTEEAAAEIFTAIEESTIPELPLPTFGAALPIDEVKSSREDGSKSSSKFMMIGAIAAGVVLIAAGGWWYTKQQPAGVNAGASPTSAAEESVASLPVATSPTQPQGTAAPQKNPPPQSNSPALTNASAKSNVPPSTPNAVPAAASAHNSQPAPNPANGGTGASADPAAEQPKKPVLGEVHLATPKLTPNKRAQNGGEPDAGIALTNDSIPEAGAEGLNTGLLGDSKQPSAPAAVLPVGGDVRQAKLISHIDPVYPTLARNQRISGSVVIDALIDANGRVTTMKVVSGPTLLHQSAMDALKQWKYQPAMLNGTPVSMHLSVAIQFRLQ
jgi:TonB family protein